jgi:hypothetical protein
MQRRPGKPRSRTEGLRPPLDSPALAGLLDRARNLDALDKALRDTLPAALADRCRLANTPEARIVFLVSSPSVAARLRMLQPQLLDTANRVTGQRFDSLTVKVAPTRSVPPDPQPRKPLSPAAAAHLGETATFLSDPELRDLFLRMASLA